MSDPAKGHNGIEPLAEESRERTLRHPLHAAEHEVEHLKEVAATGESPATPAILVVTWIAMVLPLLALVIGLAFGVAYLVTGSAGIRHPAGPAGTLTQTATQTGSVSGQAIFAKDCSSCYGPTGHGGIGPNLTTLPDARNMAVVVHQVTNGGGVMPSFKGTLDEQQIKEVATYVSGVIARGRS